MHPSLYLPLSPYILGLMYRHQLSLLSAQLFLIGFQGDYFILAPPPPKLQSTWEVTVFRQAPNWTVKELPTGHTHKWEGCMA